MPLSLTFVRGKGFFAYTAQKFGHSRMFPTFVLRPKRGLPARLSAAIPQPTKGFGI